MAHKLEIEGKGPRPFKWVPVRETMKQSIIADAVMFGVLVAAAAVGAWLDSIVVPLVVLLLALVTALSSVSNRKVYVMSRAAAHEELEKFLNEAGYPEDEEKETEQ